MIKLSAPHIFDGEKFLCENSIVVVDDEGFVLDIIHSSTKRDDTLYLEEGILCPGFVNAHCHLELSYLKNTVAQHLGMATFIEKMVKAPSVALDIVKEHILHNDDMMWQNGIQAVGDICNTNHTVLAKRNSNIQYHSFLELIERADRADIIQRAEALQENFQGLAYSCVPHSPYTLSADSLKYIFRQFSNAMHSIHYNESQVEKDLLQLGQGALFEYLSVLYNHRLPAYTQYNHWLSEMPQHLILVHNTFSTEADIEYITTLSCQKKSSVFFCFCVNANQYINDTLPPIDLFGELKNCCIGTDSLASNTSLSVLEEIKKIHNHFPSISVARLLRMATSQGAKALQMEEELGLFRTGLHTGVVHITQANEVSIAPTSRVKRIV